MRPAPLRKKWDAACIFGWNITFLRPGAFLRPGGFRGIAELAEIRWKSMKCEGDDGWGEGWHWEKERGGKGGKDKQEKNYISQLPINRPMAALLVK